MEASFPPPASPNTFKDQTIVVSGGAGVIGRAICFALARAGANVVVNDVEEDGVNEVVSSIQSDGYSALGVTLSATQGPVIIGKTITQYGSVHAVINAVLGVIPWGPFEDSTDDDFRGMFESTVLGPLSLTRAAWHYFKEQKFGRIVNFTSDSMLGMPTGSTYTMTKGALFGLNKTLAMEGARYDIKINCISPISYRPQMERHIAPFSDEVKEGFRTLYTPDGNVPMVLALVSEGCEASGEVFQTAARAVGRTVLGTVKGEKEMRTVEECLEKVNDLCKKGSREVFEPSDMADYTAFQAKYVLGK